MRLENMPTNLISKRRLLLALLLCFCSFAQPRFAASADDFEVVVVGGTPGGIASAITAARLGHTVALLEYHNHLGGMSASGLGKTDIETPEAIGGLFKEFIARVYDYYVKKYGAESENVKLCRKGYYYEPHVAERIFDEMVAAEPKIRVFKRHRLDKVIRAGNRVTGLIATDRASKQPREFSGRMFIDATYEGDLTAYAGARYRLGRESRAEFNEIHAGVVFQDPRTRTFLSGSTGEGDNRLQSYTFRLCLTTDPANSRVMTAPPPDYDRKRYVGYFDDLKAGRLGAPTPTNATNGTLVRAFTIAPIPNRKTDCNSFPRVLAFPFVEENYDYPEADWETREKITARIRNITLGLLYFIQNDPEAPAEHRALANKYHLSKDEFQDNDNFPWQLYVREARRIIGLYTLSERDLFRAPEQERAPIHADAITAGEYPIDSFPVSKRRPEAGQEGSLEGYLLMMNTLTRPYQIPYGIIVPESVDGLLVPVAASTTHVAFSSIRLEPTWMALGQAAGTAAHLAIELKKQPRELPVEAMQRELLKRGQVLTYFKDLDTKAPSFAATQYFGTKGFFKDYNLRAREPVTRAQAATWLNQALKITGAEIKVGAKWAAQWRDLAHDAPHFNDAAALSLARVIESPLEKPAFEPSRALTRAEFERWLYRFGHLLNRWPRASEAQSPEKTLRERGLGREGWTDPANGATRAQDPILRGEFCQALYSLLEQAGH